MSPAAMRAGTAASRRTGRPCRLRLERVGEVGHPKGDPATAYELTLPLNADGHIDPTSWADDPAACVVCRLRPQQPDAIGALARSPHGRWYFDYHGPHDAEGHQGIRFGDERFVLGAFIGINEDDGKTHVFRVVAVERT